MMELKVNHGVKNFEWIYIKHPMRIRMYDEKLWKAAHKVIKKNMI